jgi:hypothetical protein
VTVAAAEWVWVLAGAAAFLLLGLGVAAALGLAWIPADLGRRLRLRARAPDVRRGVELPAEVPEHDTAGDGNGSRS